MRGGSDPSFKEGCVRFIEVGVCAYVVSLTVARRYSDPGDAI